MKILIVRFSSIGDVVLTTPVVRCVKQQLNDVELHFVTKKSFRTVLEGNPNIDKIHTIEKSIDEVITDLKREKYDVVIDLHNNVRTLSLKRKLGAKSYTFPKINFRKFLLTAFKINRMPKLHVVDRYFKTVEPLGVKNDLLPCDFFLTAADEVDLGGYGLEANGFVAVAMGAQFATKQMPLDLMAKALEPINIPIVLLGGPMDEERSSTLVKVLNRENCIDFCGKLSLRQSAYMTKTARVILTGDTGLMHIASCFETPIVSVWGNTVPDFGMYTYAPSKPEIFSNHEVLGLPCRPCSKIGYQSCPKKHFKCMLDQDTEKISNDIIQITSSIPLHRQDSFSRPE